MSGSYWEQVHAGGLAVPTDRPLDDLTAELTRMLGAPDPELREQIAYATLAAWIDRGVYDDLIAGLGDGMATGLMVGLGEQDTDTVFRRSWSALVIGRCIARDNARPLLAGGKILEWGDRLTTWLLRERDLRGSVPGKGRAAAVVHGGQSLAVLARSPHLATPELTVLLDVVADRVLVESGRTLGVTEADHLATATMAVLQRNTVPLQVLEPWIARIAHVACRRQDPDAADSSAVDSAEAFLRALHLQLSLGTRPPQLRSDLLLVVIDALKSSNRGMLAPTSR